MSSHGAGEVPCPDPAAHEKHNSLSEQASTAALLATGSKRSDKSDVLNKDGKLSSASAAASLKYAKAQDLPSFPSVGVDPNSAGAAAMLAKDYKMKEIWHPEAKASEAGSKAALLAVKDGGKLDLWQPTASKEGNSAANIAMRTKNLSPQLDRGYTPEGHSNALLAATMSTKQSRQRAGSTPSAPADLYPDQSNSAHNALNAATVSSRNSTRSSQPSGAETLGYNSPAMQAARIQNIGGNVNPEMWGERPPVDIEVQEKKHQEALHASAISMAKQLYTLQNQKATGANPAGTTGAEVAQARSAGSMAPADLKSEALKYITLQDAAHKLAQERLAKVDKEHENAKYREYYGYGNTQQASRSKLSMRSGRSRRGLSDPDIDSDDEQGARRVRGQMSQFSTALADVDAKKQAADRKALLAIAERNVHKTMDRMDDKVFEETGKVSQSKMDEWAAKARAKAQVESDVRQQNHGKTHVGGGKFMEQSEIEAIALARLKPTLDEIDDTAAKKRARDEELRLEKEEQERTKIHEKQQHQHEKEEAKKAKSEEKAAAKLEKEAAKKERDVRKSVEVADRRKSVEQKDHKSLLTRLASKRKSRDAKKDTVVVPVDTTDTTADKASTTPVDGGAPAVVVVPTGDEPLGKAGDEETASLERTETAHTGHLTDAMPSPTKSRKPDLERHISAIASSSSSDSDWEESEGGKTATPIVATAGALAPTPATGPSVITGVHDHEEKEKHAGLPLVAAGASGLAAAATAPAHDQAHAMSVAERVLGSPVVDEPASAAQANPAIPTLSSTAASPTTSTITNTTSPIALGKPEKADTDSTKPTSTKLVADATMPAKATTSANTAPIVGGKLQKSSNQQPAHTSTGNSVSTTTAEEKEGKGFRGFFSKLRGGKTSKADEKPLATSEATTSTSTEKSATAAAVAPITTTSTAAAVPLVVDTPASPSSFRRHDRTESSKSISSLSSGLDEDDVRQGRTGRSLKSKQLTSGRDEVVSPENEQFEEARDHFDEGLAPQPAFAGQAKSQSPARETRFREEV